MARSFITAILEEGKNMPKNNAAYLRVITYSHFLKEKKI